MPAADLTLLIEAAREAGRIARRFWRRSPETWDKEGGEGPVTEADLAVNRMLASDLRGARPDYGWLSEESEDSGARQNAERVFIVDPIDGTRAFIAGEETFSHSLAVTREGRVTAAVVYLPIPDLMFSASLDRATHLNGAPIRPSARTELSGASILTTRPSLDPLLWPGGVPDIKRAFRASLAYRMCLVAEGRHDGMVTLRDAWEWDIAAGDLIVRQSGGVVSDRHGEGLRFNAAYPKVSGVLAAPVPIHKALRDHLLPGQ